MSEYFELITNAQTGEVTRRDWTQEEIDAYLSARAVVSVPTSITPRQCRLLLLQQGLLSQVETMISQSTDDVRITWEYALEFKRDDPILNQLGTSLGLTEQQIDQFFIAASAL